MVPVEFITLGVIVFGALVVAPLYVSGGRNRRPRH